MDGWREVAGWVGASRRSYAESSNSDTAVFGANLGEMGRAMDAIESDGVKNYPENG